jgi:adapter protein MecA 1/2
MKIEKISDTQMHFILSEEDLKNRNLSLTDLSYGSIPSKKLISELLSISSSRYDFKQEDNTLTIEAVPMPDGSLDITFTIDPFSDAIDTRYSTFSRTEVSVPSGFDEDGPKYASNAREVLDLYRTLRDKKKLLSGKDSVPDFSNISKTFKFKSLDDCIALSKLLAEKYHGDSSLCRLTDYPDLYMVLRPGKLKPAEFNNICNIASDFGTAILSDRPFQSALHEHGEVILSKTAVETLIRL